MTERFQAIKGMPDILPMETALWQHLEAIFCSCLTSFGYREIRMPLLESTQLFKRSMGEVTDVVEKEMYTFTDKNGDSISLRPEGTAGCVRTCIEHGLIHRQEQRLWYRGPMFRHEKPQKGRYRQFMQMGVEVFGLSGVAIELELLAMTWSLWKAFGIEDLLSLEVNTLGTFSERQAYQTHLIAYFEQHWMALDEDSQRRLYKNPLRILDSKNAKMLDLIKNAPVLYDFLSETSRSHFEALCEGLTRLGIPFIKNPCLVRGLDYYEHTVFEWTTQALGSQGTVCAGGRFDRLVEALGGKAIPGVGFALGADRLVLLLKEIADPIQVVPLIYCIVDQIVPPEKVIRISQILREIDAAWTVLVDWSGASFKSQFKKADKSGARLALVFGEDEIKQGVVTIKDLRIEQPQCRISDDHLIEAIRVCLEKGEYVCLSTPQKRNS